MSAIATLAPQLKKLTPADGVELLARAVHKSKRELKELVAELAPKPDVPPSVRKVPRRAPNTHQTTGAETPQQETSEARPSAEPPTPSGQSDRTHSSAPASEARDPRAKLEPLAPARYIVRFTASGELRDKLERLTALTPGSDLASIIDAAVRL